MTEEEAKQSLQIASGLCSLAMTGEGVTARSPFRFRSSLALLLKMTEKELARNGSPRPTTAPAMVQARFKAAETGHPLKAAEDLPFPGSEKRSDS